ncbi:MAG TPA: hypothetical protein VF526_05640 [Solirubrobacteraceae bacterium]|jgi:hypothetical protein
MHEEHDPADSNATIASTNHGAEPGIGRGLERALRRLTLVDEHLRKLDEHVSRARAAERAAAR